MGGHCLVMGKFSVFMNNGEQSVYQPSVERKDGEAHYMYTIFRE